MEILELTHGKPVLDLNDEDPNNDELGAG